MANMAMRPLDTHSVMRDGMYPNVNLGGNMLHCVVLGYINIGLSDLIISAKLQDSGKSRKYASQSVVLDGSRARSRCSHHRVSQSLPIFLYEEVHHLDMELFNVLL